nr:DMT family transporter [Pseudaestuariivita rosea]
MAIICATALMALQDTIVKLFSEGLPLWQLFLLRSALILPVLIVMNRHGKAAILQALDRWVLLRSFLIVAMYVFFYAALPLLDLSVVAGVYYTAPLWIFLFSVIFLGERVTALQTLIMVAAFCGVLIVLQPGSAAFTRWSVVPLLAAICYALVALITRARIQSVDTMVLVISLNLVFVCVGGLGVIILEIAQPAPIYPFMMISWSPLTKELIAITGFLSAISVGVHLLLAKAYQLGPTITVASLDYSYLVFVALWGGLFLWSVPGPMVILGTMIIGAAGLAMLWISSSKI